MNWILIKKVNKINSDKKANTLVLTFFVMVYKNPYIFAPTGKHRKSKKH
ncbi:HYPOTHETICAL PROTEIN MCJ_002150 [Mesomycoplasma conjunctivae]|uniref:Uncharacterized protein n=1 Tax=Mesomycoplasma conjunctivae (strain ATCC 25834 / NCTC 10147 / HRC/581) TaxID=572263 RepID=C5J614_MESCH|nr:HYPOTHETICAL PROTEIN MCJ_002150 [Mesomycoplasma conjunctivae]